MPDPVIFKFRVQTPQGIQTLPTIGNLTDSPEDVAKKIEAKGLQVLDFHGVKAIPPAQGAQPAPSQGSMGTDLASAGLQIGVPAALAAARLLPGGKILPALIGAGAGLAPYLLKNRGLPSAGEAVGVAAGEVPLGRMIPGAIRRPVAEALKGSQLVQDAARIIGPIYQRPTERAGKLLLDAKRILLGAEPAMKDALKQTLSTWGIDITKMNDRQLLQTVMESPERAAAAFNAFEKASGRKIADPAAIQRLWASGVIHGSGRGVKEGARAAKGLLVEPGGGILLDGKAVSEAWNKLTAEGQATFGNEGKRAFDGLVAAIDGLKSAPKGIRQLAVSSGDRSVVSLRPNMAALERVIRAHPMGAFLGAGGMMEAAREAAPAVMHNPGMAAAAVGAAATFRIGKKAAGRLMEGILSTPAGVDWLTQGVRMQAQGLPTVMIADALSRSLIRATPILASLGLTSGPGGTNAAPTASPAQPGPGVGFSLPGGGS